MATGSGRRAVAVGFMVTAGMSALVAAVSGGRAQSRARYADEEGYVERGGQRLFYEVYGSGHETIFLLPTWSLLHARHWKFQIPYLARHFRVVAMDGLGNGRSGRCRETARYEVAEFARDCLAVLDVTGTERAAMVGLSRGGQYLLELARLAPERVAGAAFISPRFPYTATPQTSDADQPLGHRSLGVERHPWWRHEERGARQREYAAFAEWFVGRCLPEPHSTKGIEDGVGWALDTDCDTMAATIDAAVYRDRETLSQLARGLPGPVLVVQGDLDIVNPPRDAVALAELTGGQLRTLPDAGHFAHLRKPVATNLALRDFAEQAFRRRRDPVVRG
jgi:pimeloyl-ACP methyl ester carboxylesterase